MCGRILFYADRQRSRRYQRIDLLDALNIAKNACVLDRYDNIKKKTGYSFESVQRIRDELYTILKNQNPILASANFTPQPLDYYLEVLMYVTINGVEVLSSSATYEENDLTKNVYSDPSNEEPIHRKAGTGWIHQWGDGVLNSANLWYLRPSIDLDWSDIDLPSGTVLSTGTKYYVNLGPVTYNGTTYKTGDTFVGFNNVLATSNTGTVNTYVDCDLPEIIHEEIPKVAASVLMGTFENYQKSLRIEQEVKRS